MHRFFVPPPLPATGIYTFAGEAAHRVTRVLRMGLGERLRLFDGSGREVEGTIAGLKAGNVAVAVTEELSPGPPELPLALYQALIRPNRFEWLLEKATELGAALIQPVITERCQVRPAEFGAAKLVRWRRILVEASEQCGRRTVPELGHPLQLDTVLRRVAGLLVLPWEESRGEAPLLGDALRSANRETDGADQAVSLFIGPEGGFTTAEAAAAKLRGALVVSLGPRVLRAETAAIAALAVAGDARASTFAPPNEGSR